MIKRIALAQKCASLPVMVLAYLVVLAGLTCLSQAEPLHCCGADVVAGDPGQSFVDPPALTGAMAPNLTTSEDGLLLSWLEPVPAGDVDQGATAAEVRTEMRLRFARFDGQTWSEPRTIVQGKNFFANWADLPSVMVAPDGSLLAHWLESAGDWIFAYHIKLARSTDDGRTWTELGRLHIDDDSETEHGFVSHVIEGEAVRLFWLDGRQTTGGRSEDGGHGHGHDHGEGEMQLRTALVQGESISKSVLLDSRVCECCNTSAAMTQSGPIIAYRDRAEGEVRDISVARFVDGEWTEPQPVYNDGWAIPGCPVNGPAIDALPDGRVAVAWYTAAAPGARVQVAFSDDGGATFGEPIVLDRESPIGRVGLVLLSNGDAVVTWLASDPIRGNDSGMIRIQRISANELKGNGAASASAVTVARTSTARRSGFPMIAPVEGNERKQFLVVWTQPQAGATASNQRATRLRAVVVEP